jgi:hypothetical protein
LEIENVTTNEIYQLTYQEAIEQIQMTKKYMEIAIYLDMKKINHLEVQ